MKRRDARRFKLLQARRVVEAETLKEQAAPEPTWRSSV